MYVITNHKCTQIYKHISLDLIVEIMVDVQCCYWNNAESWKPVCSLLINQYFDL
jgi:hypothetical protein